MLHCGREPMGRGLLAISMLLLVACAQPTATPTATPDAATPAPLSTTTSTPTATIAPTSVAQPTPSYAATSASTPTTTPTPPSAPTPGSTPVLPPPGPASDSVTVMFQDDFEDSVLDDWNVEPTAWSLGVDGWVAESAWSIEDDGGDLVLSSPVLSDGWPRAEVRNRTFGDFIVQVQVKLLEGGATLVFRHYERGESRGQYEVSMEQDAIILRKQRDDRGWELASAESDLDYGQWHTLTVTGEGGAIAITLDGALVLSYEDKDDPILTGRIAFSTWGHTHLDDVVIWLDIPSSDAVTWSPTAPMPAGGVWSISVAPSNPDIVYLATRSNNAFRSEDGGRTWVPKGRLGAHIFANIAVHPTNPDIIYVSNGVVHRSADGGDTMRGQGPGRGDPDIRAIAIYTPDPDVVYAGGRNGDVFKTANGGQDWELVGLLPGELSEGTLLVQPTDPDSLFVAVQNDGVYKSGDGGASWSRVLEIPPSDQSLVMHPTNPDTLYVTDMINIYRTTDGGARWVPLGIPFLGSFPQEPRYLAIATSDPSVLYVSTPLGVHRSSDGGESWSRTGYHPGRYGHAPALAVSPADADVVFAGAEDGVVLSTDGGASWSWSNEGLADHDAWQLAISPTDPDRLHVGTLCMRGVFETTDAGASWALAPEYFHYVMDIVTVPSQPEVLYVTHHDGLRQSLDGGHTWRRVTGTSDYHLHGLAVDPLDTNVVYVGAVGGMAEGSGPYATIYKTTDGGRSWTESNNGFPPTDTSVQAIAIDPTNTDTVYVATYWEGLTHNPGRGGAGIGIYKSTDGSGSWMPVSRGLTTPNVASLAMDPFDPLTIYAGTDLGLFVTTNGGEGWAPVGGVPAVLINAIVPDPATPGTLYLTTEEAGVFRTTDGGASWVSLNQGLPLLPLGDLVLDAANGALYVAVRGGYATTPDGGVYRGTTAN